MTTSVAEEAENISSAGDNRACSDRRSEKDECGNETPSTERRDCPKKPLCYGYR